MRRFTIAVLVGTAVLAGPASAGPLSRGEVPEPLRPWVDWVLHGHEDAVCPTIAGSDQRQCTWPSRLALTLDDRGGRFRQEWLVQRAAVVPLPGDATRWPADLQVDGKPAPMTVRDGAPAVRLPAGTHAVTGTFAWDALPEMLAAPPATGLLTVTLRGQPLPFPNRDAQGRLWLQARRTDDDTEAKLDITVQRRLTDDVPLLLATRIDLRVAGRPREVKLARPVPEAFVPLALDSPLPARLDDDGRLRVQLRPGTWTITITARHDGPLGAVALPPADGTGGIWDREEVWVFEARPALRQVGIEGVPPVDPQQTTLPEEWRHLPAYLLRPGSTMRLVETRRGDDEPPPDQLSLDRTWWLDFHGGGYTVHDRITGTMRAAWRLEMGSPSILGRVAVNGVDQPITRLGDTGAAGVEIRPRDVRIDADSRLADDLGAGRAIPAVGWSHDFAAVSGTLHLPPGWRLAHASGADLVSPTWLGSWTLLDLFVVLIAALAVARLWGPGWGVVALVAVGLAYPEPGAPRWAWLALLAAEGLVRALPPGRARRMAAAARMLGVVALIAVAAPFLVDQVRVAVYPALERPDTGSIVATEASAPLVAAKRTIADSAVGGTAALVERSPIEPGVHVTTGPGLPTWSWSTVTLRWRGPVEHTQDVSLVLVSPRVNFALGFARVGLVVLLLLRLVGNTLRVRADALAIGAFLLAAATPGIAAAELPTPALLDELRARLLEPPDCAPDCAVLGRLVLEAQPARLRGRLEVDAAADTAVALPGGAPDWSPDVVLVDDRPAEGLTRTPDGRLWLAVAAGRHQVLLDGALPAHDTVRLPLPSRPRRVEIVGGGWTVTGLREDGVPDDNLQLTRPHGEGTAPGADADALPAFVRVERTLHLGLRWEVETRVERLSPVGTPLVLEVPLLAGEAVTSGDVHAEGGSALVNLSPSARAVEWRSVLDERPTIRLRAPVASPWVEVWRVDVGHTWHLESDGLPTVQAEQTGTRLREWRPWPGESVTLTLGHPGGVPGQTLTIDRSTLVVRPGLRATDATLALAVRASQGGRHTIKLPVAAELQSVMINGAPQPIRQEGATVTIPVVPGSQAVELAWREAPAGIRRRFLSPVVDLGAPSVNAETHITIPADRWILALRGPRLGPAVLYWTVLVVVLLAATGLGQLPTTPLRTRHWFLLGVGLTQAPVWVAIVVTGWLLALGLRQTQTDVGDRWFDLRQLVLVAWTVLALSCLFWSIQQGLLGLPEMQIAGNGSTAQELRWYQDRTRGALPRASVLSVPLSIYRGAMLAWSLWLAAALLGWLRWGWECFGTGGLWRPLRRRPALP
jgi:hypothetical protein